MDKSELIRRAVVLSKQPAKVEEIELAIEEATTLAHSTDFYFRDLITKTVYFPNPAVVQQLDIASLFPRFRKIGAILPIGLDGTPGAPLNPLPIKDLFNEYAVQRTNSYYGAGTVINVKAEGAINGVVVAYYASPILNPYQSWIAEQYPYAIIRWALSIVFNEIGWKEEANAQFKLAQEQLALVTQDNLEIAL